MIKGSKVVVFGRKTCPHCKAAYFTAECLQTEGEIKSCCFKPVEERDHWMKKHGISDEKVKSYMTVPQIFVSKKFIGGNSEFQKLVRDQIGPACTA